MSYRTLVGELKGKRGVRVVGIEGHIEVWHYSTCIFELSDEGVKLSSGGWFSATTRKHINTCLYHTDSFLRLYQKDFTWYLSTPKGEIVFFDGITYEF